MTRAYIDQLKINGQPTPLADEAILPVGTEIVWNTYADIDAGLPAGSVVVVTVNGPGKARWNSRTAQPLEVGAAQQFHRTYQTLDVVGDWYIQVNVKDHRDGLLGAGQETEIHVE